MDWQTQIRKWEKEWLDSRKQGERFALTTKERFEVRMLIREEFEIDRKHVDFHRLSGDIRCPDN